MYVAIYTNKLTLIADEKCEERRIQQVVHVSHLILSTQCYSFYSESRHSIYGHALHGKFEEILGEVPGGVGIANLNNRSCAHMRILAYTRMGYQSRMRIWAG